MVVVVGIGGKGFSTLFTHERLFSCVSTHVALKSGFAAERLVANCALKRLFTCVGQHVPLQVGSGLESLMADFALHR
jgi:hypothetical protein